MNMTAMTITNKRMLLAITALSLAMLGLAFMKMPYMYYQFMKIALTVSFCYMANTVKNWLSIPYIGLAIVFNPIVPLVIKKSQWEPIDAISISILVILGLIILLTKPKSEIKKAS